MDEEDKSSSILKLLEKNKYHEQVARNKELSEERSKAILASSEEMDPKTDRIQSNR